MNQFAVKADHRSLARLRRIEKSCAAVFISKPRNKIKILHWQGDGFVIYSKRLENGRKKYLFASSQEAAQNAAMFYSLLGTCKIKGVEPF